MDLFRVIDEILDNYNQEYNDELLIICYGFIFRRIKEISCWDISQDERNYIKYKLSLIVREEELKEYESFNSRKR